MTTEELRELLVPTHIYYDVGTKSLNDRAFGEMITKTLFMLAEKKARFSEIQDAVAKIVGVTSLTNQNIQSGLEFLKNQNAVTKQGKFWFLSKETSERVEKDINKSQERINHILDKHFGTKIDRSILEKWFKLSIAAFYGEYSEVFSKRLKGQSVILPSEESLLSVLEKPTVDLKLEKHREILKNGFNSFLKDTKDPLITQQIWSFAQAMLSAKLVNASIGPDPISINEFRNTKLFLDTNVLFIIALEKSKLSPAFSSLASSINQIGATLHATQGTCEEYKKVVARKRQEALRVIEEFPFDVVEEARDSFIKTAISRGCVDRSSFETFFNSIYDVPTSVAGEKINIEDYPALKKASEVGANDKKRKDDIAEEWLRIHNYSKSQGAIVHDASLDGVADFLKGKGENICVLTVDTAMQNVSIKWSGSGNPVWVGLDAFIQILAVSGVGTAHAPENFAPLLNSIITGDVYSSDKVFTLEDLDALLDLEERVKELSKDEIKDFASKIAKLRMSGRPKNDSELQLEIRRTFQRKKMNNDEDTQRLENRARVAEQDLSGEQKKRTAVENYLLNKIIKEETIKLYLFCGASALILIFLGIIITWRGYNLINTNSNFGWFLIGVGLIEIILASIKWIIPQIKAIPRNSRDRAELIFKKLL